jgi:hypothetical protein
MMKLGILLFLIVVMLIAAGCTAGGGQATAVDPGANQIELNAADDSSMVKEPLEPASGTINNPALSEVPATTTAAEEAPGITELPGPTTTPALAPLLVIGPAPGWNNETWINTDNPLPLEDLRGKVVLLEFWTFG